MSIQTMTQMNSMFLIEIILEYVETFGDCENITMKAEFTDIFSFTMKDPKNIEVVIPDPPPPVVKKKKGKKGKKGKKEKKAKNKKKKGKGKKGKLKKEITPTKPAFKSGRSCLFPSSIESLQCNMKNCPIVISLWSENGCVGSTKIIWPPSFFEFLNKISVCEQETPLDNSVRDVYNIFEEETSKLMATVMIEVKLSYIKDEIKTHFKVLPTQNEEICAETENKMLYLGPTSPTSFMCNIKVDNNEAKESTFVIEQCDAECLKKIVLTSEKNKCKELCCRDQDKFTPTKLLDLDFVAKYVDYVVKSCTENLKTIQPLPEIKLKRRFDESCLCHCFDREPKCPDCLKIYDLIEQKQKYGTCVKCNECHLGTCDCDCIKPSSKIFNIEDIRGPCGKKDCQLASDMKNFLTNLISEDNTNIIIDDIEGPCGNKDCLLVNKIQQFLRKEGNFAIDLPSNNETSCECESKMQNCEDSAAENECPVKKSMDNDKTYRNNVTDTVFFNAYYENFIVGYCNVVNQINNKNQNNKETYEVAKSDNNSSAYDSENDLVDIQNIRGPCGEKDCDLAQKIRQFLLNQNFDEEISICDCIDELDLKTETTYCAICGGYEILGDDVKQLPPCSNTIPPCPVYHKEINTNVENQMENETNPFDPVIDTSTINKRNVQKNETRLEQTKIGKKQETIKAQDKKKKSKFTVTNPHKVPVTGHNQCYDKKQNVPRNMGWLWNEDIPGLKLAAEWQPFDTIEKSKNYHLNEMFILQRSLHLCEEGRNNNFENSYRPEWRPGAVSRRLNKLYRQVRNTHYLFARKKKKLKPKKEKGIPKPTVIITKKDGEYEVQMEVLKSFSKERLIYQYPYEDVDPYMYKIGRTDIENEKRKLKMERRERRRKRRDNKYLQKTFEDTCKDVCLKAYKQAIGELPMPDPNNPECPCFPKDPTLVTLHNDSCSCSDSSNTSSDSDGDDGWVIQFTPPAAKFDPNQKSRLRQREEATQYSYLDFRVKILDKNGKQVPRFFIGPDGKEYCSDLGGFMGPDGKWLVIGKDGTIGPDGRWIPLGYYDSNGKWVELGDDSVYVDENGNRFTVGVDGYINAEGKWVSNAPTKSSATADMNKTNKAATPLSWVCMPKLITTSVLAQQQIMPHGRDEKMLRKQIELAKAQGKNYQMPEKRSVPKFTKESHQSTKRSRSKKKKQ